MTEFEIPRISWPTSPQEVNVRYLLHEKPVIIERVPIESDLRAFVSNRAFIDELLANESPENVDLQTDGWIDVTDEVCLKRSSTKQIYVDLQKFVPDQGVARRPTHVRFWGSPQGRITPWHYDGNGLTVLNLQVVGRKFWQIVSPRTPLAAFPFVSILCQGAAPLNKRQKEELEWAQFEAGPGDLLILPRFWAHSVISLERWNANVNIVYTSRVPAPSSPNARRERRRVVAVRAMRESLLWRLLPERDRRHAIESSGYSDNDVLRNVFPDTALRPSLSQLTRDIVEEMRTLDVRLFNHLRRRLLGRE